MAKNTPKPDTILKSYWNGTERFADIFNAVLYDGDTVIHPKELAPYDTDSSTVLEYSEFAESLEASRDKIKVHKKPDSSGKGYELLGLEFQEYISYVMPLRVMGYDNSVYQKLYKSNAEKYKGRENRGDKNMTRDEWLSRMKKTDKLIPVITIVLYFGQEPWDGPTSLRDMLDIPANLEGYVNDYRPLLVEARNSKLKLHNDDNIDLFGMLRIALDRSRPSDETRKLLIRYADERDPSREVLMVVYSIIGVKMDYDRFEREGGNMRTVFDDVYEEGRAQEIIGIYREQGFSDEGILVKLQTRLNVSLDRAWELLAGKQLTCKS